MPISRRLFLRNGAQALSAASLLGAVPGLATCHRPGAKERQRPRHQRQGRERPGGIRRRRLQCGGPGRTRRRIARRWGPGGEFRRAAEVCGGYLKTKRVQTLINTHWHPEQTGSNEAVGKAGGTLISHEVSRLALGRRETSALYEGYYGPLPPKAIPTQTTYNTGSLMFAGEQVDYRYLPAAHTNGDLFIHFPKRNVIVAGGPVAADHWPVMDYKNGAFMHGFVRSYEILAEVAKPDTIIIPANGPTLTGADIVKQKDMYWALFKQFFIDFNKGFGPYDIVDAHPLKDFEAQYGDPAQFLEYAYRSLQLATIPH